MSAPTKPEEVLPDEEVQNHSPWWQRFVTGSSTWIGLILVGLILVFSTLEYESFVSSSNARNVATDAAAQAAVQAPLARGSTCRSAPCSCSAVSSQPG